ncbi:uncharacterized protein LOC144280794 isoform X2 [Canis aureus]
MMGEGGPKKPPSVQQRKERGAEGRSPGGGSASQPRNLKGEGGAPRPRQPFRVGVTFTLLPDLHKSSAPPDSQTWYDAEPEPRRHFINSKERTGAQVIAKNMDYLRYSPSLFFCECTYS